MTTSSTSRVPSAPGAFLQLIDYHTDQPDQMQHILGRWLEAIGAERTTRWYLTAADRDQPGHYLQIVEFPRGEPAPRGVI